MKSARINWDWLETEGGILFLEKLNARVVQETEFNSCEDIDCPFDFDCQNNCDKAFRRCYQSDCPCYTYTRARDLAIILSDYYEMEHKK